MNSQEARETFRKEGFKDVYEWKDKPGTEYKRHKHSEAVSLIITKGDLKFFLDDGSIIVVTKGQRFDVPIGVYHRATVGPEGCEYIVGDNE